MREAADGVIQMPLVLADVVDLRLVAMPGVVDAEDRRPVCAPAVLVRGRDLLAHQSASRSSQLAPVRMARERCEPRVSDHARNPSLSAARLLRIVPMSTTARLHAARRRSSSGSMATVGRSARRSARPAHRAGSIAATSARSSDASGSGCSASTLPTSGSAAVQRMRHRAATKHRNAPRRPLERRRLPQIARPSASPMADRYAISASSQDQIFSDSQGLLRERSDARSPPCAASSSARDSSCLGEVRPAVQRHLRTRRQMLKALPPDEHQAVLGGRAMAAGDDPPAVRCSATSRTPHRTMLCGKAAGR